MKGQRWLHGLKMIQISIGYDKFCRVKVYAETSNLACLNMIDRLASAKICHNSPPTEVSHRLYLNFLTLTTEPSFLHRFRLDNIMTSHRLPSFLSEAQSPTP